MNPWMQRALALAERGRGRVEPNPLVGAVIVRAGQVVGEGWHEQFGQAHAEVNALAAAKEAARGADLFVTLEPCCHFGKTPPCTDAIIRAGIARVFAAMADPFPQVAGKGAEQLRAAGIAIEIGLGEAKARALNAPYLKLLASGKPYVHAKWAMSLDGKIATRGGDSRWISNEESRRRVHDLRGRMDAIIIGIGTALADDPLLSARPPGPRTACRVILDSRGRLPITSQLARSAREFPTLLATRSSEVAPLQSAGIEILQLTGDTHASAIRELLLEMGRRRCTNVLVEGGGTVLGAFLDAGEIDEVHVFIAPLLIGGKDAVSPIGGLGVAKIAEACRINEMRIEKIGDDVYLHGIAGTSLREVPGRSPQ